MIHGLFASATTYDAVKAELSQRSMTAAIDLPDCGQSDAASGFRPSWISLTQTVIDAADAMGMDEFDLVGHSMGGGVSIMIAAQYPERVRRLILVDAVSFPFKVPLKGRLPLVPIVGELLFWTYSKKMFVSFIENDVFNDKTLMDMKKVDYLYRVFAKKRSAALDSLRATADPRPVTDSIEKITCPTLLIWGSEDRLVPLAIGRLLNKKIPNSRLCVLDGCGHSPLEERPTETAAEIISFLH